MSSATRRSIVQLTRIRPSQSLLHRQPAIAFNCQPAITFNSTPRRFQSDDASSSPVPAPPEIQNIQETGLNDSPYIDSSGKNDWSQSFHGLSTEPFPKEIAEALNEPIDPEDIEIKPGMPTLPFFPLLSLYFWTTEADVTIKQMASSTSPKSSTAASSTKPSGPAAGASPRAGKR